MSANTPRRWSAAWLMARAGVVLPNLITLALAGIGAAAGFRHTHDWAEHHGQHGWLAWADAVVIECMCLVAGFEIHRCRLAAQSAALPGTVLAVGFLVQMTAQVADAEPSPAGWLLAATPALGFLVVVKMVMRRLPADQNDPQSPDQDTANQDTANQDDEDQGPRPPASPGPDEAPRPAPPVTVPRVRLPQPLIDQITALVERIRAEGREPTAEDIRTAVKVPDQMAAQILASMPAPPTPINGHRVA
jgi:uncharacterized protein DUF2637